MRLLILTQKIDINDDVLGFFHDWVKKFAEKCEKVTVVTLGVGEYDLPKNVKVLSLGKPATKIRYILNFYKYIWQERKNYDSVFVHMNTEYVILGGLLWRLLRKKVGFWYAHGKVSFKVVLAEKIANTIFSSTQSGFRLRSKKLNIVGQGINIDKFKLSAVSRQPSAYKIITVGRIAPVKNLDILIEVAKVLRNKNFNFCIEIAGAPILEKDKIYFEKLKKIDDKVKFIGSISNKNVIEFYQSADLFVNFSDTGSMDKAVLEAMACGCLVLTSNEAFRGVLDTKYRTNKKINEIADKIIILSSQKSDPLLRDYVVKNHNLENLVKKIICAQ